MRFYSMSYQQIGYLGYRFYTLGWRNGVHNYLPPGQHWLLSLFVYYRRGYAEGSEWIEEYRLEGNLR